MNAKLPPELKTETGKTFSLKRNRIFYFSWNALWVPIRRALVRSVNSLRSIQSWGRGSTMNTNRYFLRKRTSERSPHMKMLLSCMNYIRWGLFTCARSIAKLPLTVRISSYWKGRPFLLFNDFQKIFGFLWDISDFGHY